MPGVPRSRGRPLWRRIARRTAKAWLRWRYRHFDPATRAEHRVNVAGLHLRVLQGVFDPSLHFTSGALAEWLKKPGVVNPGASVLDVGTGSGVLAIAAVLAGSGGVVAVDSNDSAINCAGQNVRRYGLTDQVSVRQSDMFSAVTDEKFDLVLVNPPYFRGEPRTAAEKAYMAGTSLEWISRFAEGLPLVLSPTGRALMVVGDAAEIDAILCVLTRANLKVNEAGRREYLAETVYVFELRPEAQSLDNQI